MKWLTSNLYPLLVIGALLFFGSFVRIWFVKPHKIAFVSGSILLVAVLIGGLYVAFSSQDGDDTDEVVIPKPSPVVSTSLQRLQSPWDSELTPDWPVAETLASISEIAYLPPVDADLKYRSLGFNKFMPIVAGSMIGYVLSSEDVTVIAFRGTDFEEVSDWLANLDRSAFETPHGAIHKGFHDAYQSLQPQIMTLLRSQKIKHLWITGHSLGGALALVCAYDLLDSEKVSIDGVITFGQPMIAHQELADHLEVLLRDKYVRFVNEADIVPRVPPSYVHLGMKIHFTNSGIRRSKPRALIVGATGVEPADPMIEESDDDEAMTEEEFHELQAKLKVTNQVAPRLPDGTMVYAASLPLIDDHSMLLYLRKVRTLLGIEPDANP